MPEPIRQGLVFVQSINHSGRHDATGAFIPGGRAFSRRYGMPLIELDDVNDRETMINRISETRSVDTIAYFGHGTSHSLSSADIGERNTGALAAAINRSATRGCRIVLYACSSGAAGGFAESLARQTAGGGTIVFAHTTVGHAYRNPHVVAYPNQGNSDAPYLFRPGSDIFRSWQRKLHDTDLWMRFPFLSRETIASELSS